MTMSIIETFENMLAKGQDSTLLRFGLGQAYFKEEQFDKAIEHFLKTIEHDRNYSAAWKLLGKAYTAIDKTEKAIETFSDGIEIAEANGDIQAAKEMRVFLKRLQKNEQNSSVSN
mgnify:CR=1 FL=1